MSKSFVLFCPLSTAIIWYFASFLRRRASHKYVFESPATLGTSSSTLFVNHFLPMHQIYECTQTPAFLRLSLVAQGHLTLYYWYGSFWFLAHLLTLWTLFIFMCDRSRRYFAVNAWNEYISSLVVKHPDVRKTLGSMLLVLCTKHVFSSVHRPESTITSLTFLDIEAFPDTFTGARLCNVIFLALDVLQLPMFL